MPALKDKVKLVLDEARLLVLGAQILLGFQNQIFLQQAFDQIPPLTQRLMLIGLAVLLLAIALMMWPSAFHQITEHGEATTAVHRFATQSMCVALFPFALSLAIDLFAVTQHASNTTLAVVAGGATFIAAIF